MGLTIDLTKIQDIESARQAILELFNLTEVIVPRVATARPPPTMTLTPTPQPTATPTITLAPSPTPTFTLTPTLTPTPCPIGLAAEFQAIWNTYGAELGCPTAPLEVIPTLAEEFFEGGHMFWRSDTDEVYVVYDRQRHDGAILISGNWENYPSPWDGTIPPGVGPTPVKRQLENATTTIRRLCWAFLRHVTGASLGKGDR